MNKSDQHNMEQALNVTRRYFLGKCTGLGIGSLALADLLK